MALLDRRKEEVAYLKFWPGIVVITDISLIGWLVSTVETADRLRIVLAAVGVILLTFGAVVVHREIDRRMQEIGGL